MWRATDSTIVLAPPPREGSKGLISLNFNYKVICKDFLYQTLCVFSQIKDTKHIQRDFHSVAWVMPQGRDFGALHSLPAGPDSSCIVGLKS